MSTCQALGSMDLVIVPCRWHRSVSAVPAGMLPPRHPMGTQEQNPPGGHSSSARQPEGPWQPVHPRQSLQPSLASLAGLQLPGCCTVLLLDPKLQRGHTGLCWERALNEGFVPVQIKTLDRFCWWT